MISIDNASSSDSASETPAPARATSGTKRRAESDEAGATEPAAAAAATGAGAGGATRQRKRARKSRAFRFSSSIKESHGKPLFGVQFNKVLEHKAGVHPVFATVGSNRVSIYECEPSGTVRLLQAYVDEQPREIYYTCAWSYAPDTPKPILAVAGAQGIIRILSPSNFSHTKVYTGHGQAINELQFHPLDPNLLLSVSKDHAMRLWNIKTDQCVLIFGGEKGHRDEVLSADFNFDGTKLVSCGMDHCLKIWSLETPKIVKSIQASYEFEASATNDPFPTYCVHFPTFSTYAVHRNYVDCVRWMGDLVLSKSTENKIVCWQPGGEHRLDLSEKRLAYLGDSVGVLNKFEMSGCDIWYVRFSVDRGCHTLACGNQAGKVFVWSLDDAARRGLSRPKVLEHKRCISTVRQTCLSYSGNILLYVCDDGSIWRWDRAGPEAAGSEA